jgi:hypothetical protein
MGGMAKSSNNLLYGVIIGGVAMYFLKDTVKGLVSQASGAVKIGARGGVNRNLYYRYY